MEHSELHIPFAGIIAEAKVNAGKPVDAELWRTFRQGDEAAFVDIYKTYANRLYNYGVKFCNDKELVKDCLQDFFVYLHKSRERLGDTNSIKFYLFKAFRRRIVDYLKTRKSEEWKNELANGFQLQVEVSDEVKFIDRQFQEQQLSKLNHALHSLTEKEREAIFYYFYEGVSYQGIAEILNFAHVASARRLIYRALANLKKLIV